jgi:hypothetical protein
MTDPIEIFFSYAHQDEDLMNDVRRQLAIYEGKGWPRFIASTLDKPASCRSFSGRARRRRHPSANSKRSRATPGL